MHLQSLKLLSNSLRDVFTRLQYLSCDLDIEVKVSQDVAQYPLHHVTKFEAATSNGLGGGDTFTRNVRKGGTDRPTTDRLW